MLVFDLREPRQAAMLAFAVGTCRRAYAEASSLLGIPGCSTNNISEGLGGMFE
jgi:hypothetical protein